LDLVDGKVPVDGSHYLTPSSALRLNWRSATGGDWSVTLDMRGRYGRVKFAGSALRMWCYAEEAISADQAPRIMLSDSDQHGTPAIPPPAGNWVQLEIPFDLFVGIMNDTRPDTFDPQKLERFMIFQGLDDGKSHTVYIDEITVGDAMPTMAKPSAAPSGPAAKGYDRHIDLTWAPVQDSELPFYKIYRSLDGKASRLWRRSVATVRALRIFWGRAARTRATKSLRFPKRLATAHAP
jgi:hypothetical protein